MSEEEPGTAVETQTVALALRGRWAEGTSKVARVEMELEEETRRREMEVIDERREESAGRGGLPLVEVRRERVLE